MGLILACKCANCRYKRNKIYLGYCMDGPEVYYFPACDFRNKKVICVNLGYSVDVDIEFPRFDREVLSLTTENILLYSNKRLYKNDLSASPGEILLDEPDYLQSKSNYCPK